MKTGGVVAPTTLPGSNLGASLERSCCSFAVLREGCLDLSMWMIKLDVQFRESGNVIISASTEYPSERTDLAMHSASIIIRNEGEFSV